MLELKEIIDILDKKDLEYLYCEQTKSFHTYVYYLCNKHKERGKQKVRVDRLSTTNIPCKFCRNQGQTIDSLLSIEEINNDVEILSKSFENVDSKIKCKCKYCRHIWWITPAKLKSGRRCPECKNRKLSMLKRKSEIEIQNELNINNPNVELISEYINANSMIKCRCKIHNIEWISQSWNILHGLAGCPICNSSKGENAVAKILDLYNIKYIRQYKFDDCVYKAKLRFDFFLPDYNICIEYQGEQHYFPVNFKGKDNTDYILEFQNNMIRDNIKREYCINNNITLIEIPYYKIDEIENIILYHIKNP